MSTVATPRSRAVLAAALATFLVAGCQQAGESGAPAPAGHAGVAAPTGPDVQARDPLPEGPVELEEIISIESDYVVGISFPPSGEEYPAVAAAMKAYADSAREELLEAVEARRSEGGVDASAPMYDLSLTFSEVFVSPAVAAYAADGSSYTGGAHSVPLLARFVWLPSQQLMLTADRLVPEPRGWDAIALYVRDQLHGRLSQHVEEAGLPPEERTRTVRTVGGMIDQGTEPRPENFSQFEPLPGDGGRLRGLRFVFAPYEVAPYSEGVQRVEVPARVLLPSVAPQFRSLFEGASGDVPIGVGLASASPAEQ